MKIDYLEDEQGNLTKVLISEKRFETISMSKDGGEPELFALVITEEIENELAAQIEEFR